MPNVRGAPVRRFVDTEGLWPAAQEYAAEHAMQGGASAVVRLALKKLLAESGK